MWFLQIMQKLRQICQSCICNCLVVIGLWSRCYFILFICTVYSVHWQVHVFSSSSVADVAQVQEPAVRWILLDLENENCFRNACICLKAMTNDIEQLYWIKYYIFTCTFLVVKRHAIKLWPCDDCVALCFITAYVKRKVDLYTYSVWYIL